MGFSPGPLLYLAVALLLTLPLPAGAAKGEAPASKYETIKRSLEKNREGLEQAQKAEALTLHEMDKLNRRLAETKRKLGTQSAALLTTREQAEALRKEISVLRVRAQGREQWMRRKLKALGRFGRYGDEILILGSSRDMASLLRNIKYLEVLASYEKKVALAYMRDAEALAAKKAALERATEKARGEEDRTRQAALELEEQHQRKIAMLSSLRTEKSAYQRMMKDLEKSASEMKKVIEAAETRRSAVFTGKGFSKQKGRLDWPVRGRIAIAYGTHSDPRFKTPIFRNGVYISAQEETLAKSVSGGKVVYADWFEGYGQIVIINHGEGYHTLYANLSEIFLHQGDIISKYDNVGRVGTSGILDSPALYFEIRYKGKPLDPAQWLSRK